MENNFQDFKLLVTDAVCLFSKSKIGLDNKQRYSDLSPVISGESIEAKKIYLMHFYLDEEIQNMEDDLQKNENKMGIMIYPLVI